ncbi:AAA family ATPase [Mycobacterium sp.]|uniref:AAA family ATPase n=1 Tax=Mycobacterium sp. TaxID=1785 RepID=UPI0025CF5F9C|nr:AAA family ATPase [Mycobacterium sp.]MBW0013868.1 AAA family ATPase [Mycobacterium sp.]
MLVWINGPFGGGKTQTAFELHRRLPDSVVCDPEEIGFGLHRAMPRALRTNFQDYPAWRQGVYEVLDHVIGAHRGVVIAPMTVIEPKYLAETVGRLRERGHDVRHFALLANRETVLRRIHGRTLWGLSRDPFATSHVDRCLDRLRGPEFAHHVWTDAIAVPEVAQCIATSAGLALRPNTEGPVRRRLRQSWISIKHIRFA